MAIRELIPIRDFEGPELAPYRTMRRPMDHRRARIFVAEGEKVVRRLLESRLGVVSVLLPSKWIESYRPLLETRPEPIPVFTAEKPLLEQLTGYSMFQGVLAVGKMPDPPSLDDILRHVSEPPLLAATDGVCNAENLGALVRGCAAFGVHAFLSGERSSSPYVRRAVRSSMGTVFDLPVLELESLEQTLGELKARGIRCIAAHPHATARRVAEADFVSPCCIVFGSEGPGISPEILAACDEAVAIPMHGNVDSLNVGSAGAVFCYEARRQRDAARG